jgi:HK97 family phage major capsid protein
MSKLTKLLEYGFAGNSERSKLMAKESFKKTIGEAAYKTLLQSENTAITDSTLVQEEVYKTICEGAEPAKCMREVVPIINTKTYSVRFIKGQTGTYATNIAEGAKIDIDTQEFSKQDITINKIGTRPLITNELIEDSLFDIVELELKKAGNRLENKLNRDVLYQMLQGTYKVATSTMSPAGTHISVSDVALAVSKVKKQNYMPDILLVHPTAEAYLLQDSNLAYVSFAGQSSSLNQGKVPTIMGLRPYYATCTDSATPTWDDTTAGSDVTALIFSKNDFATICMRRDITVEQYDDPIHDLIGISCTMRYGTDVLRETAACSIFHK